jgi:hypothetical protein
MNTPAMPRLIAALISSERRWGHATATSPQTSPIPSNEHEAIVCHRTRGLASSA